MIVRDYFRDFMINEAKGVYCSYSTDFQGDYKRIPWLLLIGVPSTAIDWQRLLAITMFSNSFLIASMNNPTTKDVRI